MFLSFLLLDMHRRIVVLTPFIVRSTEIRDIIFIFPTVTSERNNPGRESTRGALNSIFIDCDKITINIPKAIRASGSN